MRKLFFILLAIGLILAGSVYSAYFGPVKVFEFREDGTFVNTTEDVELNKDTPTVNYGSRTSFTVDNEEPVSHVLIRFPNIFGSGEKQIPLGTKINSAVLTLDCFNKGKGFQVFRVLEDWVEGEASWEKRKTGVAWSDPGAVGNKSADRSTEESFQCSSNGMKDYDITQFAQKWSDGEPNYGIVFESTKTDGVDFYSSEHPNSSNRPLLAVTVGSKSVVAPPADPTATPSGNPGDLIGPAAVNIFEFGDIVIIALIFGLIIGVIVLGRRILKNGPTITRIQTTGAGLEKLIVKPIDPNARLKSLLSQKKKVDHMLNITKMKYHKRELDEGGYKKIVRTYQERLISIEAEIDSIQGKLK